MGTEVLIVEQREVSMKKVVSRMKLLLLSVLLASVSIEIQAQEIGGYTKLEGNNYLGEKEWNYGYTGNSQNFVAPVTGVYKFETYGAKGADYHEFCGGYGGSVIGTIELRKGENINIVVGGRNGYNGGGYGTLSNGGGATSIELNGGIIAMAGGGAGATDMADGNVGGSSSGTNDNYLYGSSSDINFSAGGGGGYLGGTSGFTKYHAHEGDEVVGGKCYGTPLYHTHIGVESTEGGCYTIPVYHTHEGESTYYGGCYTSVNYHEHKGNESEEGGCYTIPQYHTHSGSELNGTGCYTIPVMHTHNDNCPTKVCLGTSFTKKDLGLSDGTLKTCYVCNKCGFGWSSSKSICDATSSACTKGGTVEYYNLSCNIDESVISGYELGCGMLTTTPESYSLGCEKTEESIDFYDKSCEMELTTVIGYEKSCIKIENESVDDYKAAFGGTNYCNTNVCSEVKMTAGVNAGDGSVKMSLIAVEGATIAYYADNGSLLKSITVAKGDKAEYPFRENPIKGADEKYSYTFVGWDNMSTDEVEIYTNEQTIQDTLSNFMFKAVYATKGQTYVVNFDAQDAENIGSTSIIATYGMKMDKIEIPQKENHIFAGYYSLPNGMGKKYYDVIGDSIVYSDLTEDTILYAYWIQPLSIIKQPKDMLITTGYRGVVIDLNTKITANGDYTLNYQWFQICEGEAIAIANATEPHFLLPDDYKIGNYLIFCEVKVIDNKNQHSYTTHSDTICVQIVKGTLEEHQIKYHKNEVVYDGKYHSAGISVEIGDTYTVYYAREELTGENYLSKGQNNPYSFKNAGRYRVYYYIISEDYEEYADSIEFVIHKAKPEIMAWSKNVSFTGETQEIDEAKVLGINGAIIKDSVLEYIYYLDADCTIMTSIENGASVSGGAPSAVGSYYVMVSSKETQDYESVKLSVPIMLNIVLTTVDFEVHGYLGVYDKMEHSIIVDTKGNPNVSFYYSTTTRLTEQNYRTEGNITTPKFVNAGTYKIYYLMVNKLTGNLKSYIPGEATITIQKAKQYITNENMPKLNTSKNIVMFPMGGEWEYKKVSNSTTWTNYQEQSLSEGYYEFRLIETLNYYASETVLIEVRESKEENSNNTGGDKTDEKKPGKEDAKEDIVEDENKENNKDESNEKDPEENKQNIENSNNTSKKEEISQDNTPTDIPNEYEQDTNGNGIPDIFENDRNGNGIPDYYEWDMNGNGILDYLEDENRNGIPDFLEWNHSEDVEITPIIVEIQEEPVAIGHVPKQSVTEKIKDTVKEILAEENAQIVIPCVTAGMVIGLFGSYFVILLLAPFIKSRTVYRYYIETVLKGKTKGFKVNINSEVASIDNTREDEGIYRFGQLCTKEDYIITIQDKDNYSVGVVRLTFMNKRVFHEIIINRGIEIRVEQLKHGARLHIR